MNAAQGWRSHAALGVWLPAGALLLLGLAIGRFEIGAKSLWRDETFTAAYASWDMATMLPRALATDANGIAYYALLNVVGHAFGTTEAVLRLPSAIFGALSLPVVFVIARRYVTTPYAFLAGLILATSWMFAFYSQEARPYGLVLLFASGATLTLLRALDGSRAAWWVYALLAATAAYVHIWLPMLFVAHAVALAITGRLNQRPLAAYAFSVVVAMPLVAYSATHAFMVGWVPPISAQLLADTFVGLAGGSRLLIAVACASLAAVFWLAARRGRSELVLPAAWMAVPIVATVVVSTAHSMLVPRYLTLSLPAIAIVIAFGLQQLRPRWVSIGASIAVVAVTASTGVAGHNQPKEDYRSAVTFVAANAGPGDLLVSCPDAVDEGAAYYLRRVGSSLSMADASAVEAAKPSATRIWVVTLTDHREALPPLDRALAADGYRMEASRDFTGFNVRRYRLATGAVPMAARRSI